MPVFAAVGAAVAIGTAVGSVAAVGLTVGSAFAITAAVGATLGAIGTFTKSKELQIAGTVLGVIGGVGALASSAGLFGAGQGLFSTGAEAAASAAGATAMAPAAAGGEVTSLAATAAEGATAAGDVFATAAPAGGYTLETLNNAMPGALAGFEGVQEGMKNIDIINLVNDLGTENFNALAPAEQLAEGQIATPAAEVLPQETAAAAPAEQVIPEAAQPPSLMETAQAQVGLDGLPRDAQGNLVAQGGGEGTPLGNVNNPAATDLPTFDGGGAKNPAYGAMDPAGLGAPSKATATAGDVVQPNNVAPTDTGTGVTGSATSQPAAGTSPVTPTGATPAPTPAAGASTQAADALINAPVTGGITKVGSSSDDKGVFGSILDFFNKNQTLGLGAIMGASSFISGAFKEGMSEEQRNAYDTQAQQNLASANLARSQDELLQRRLRNMSQPIPMAVAGPPPGLMQAAVTGRPA